MEILGKVLVTVFAIGTCGAIIALALTLVDYVHTLSSKTPQSRADVEEQAS